MVDKSYEDGIRDGKITALEGRLKDHGTILDAHDGRLRLLERAVWIAAGVTLAVQIIPEIIDGAKTITGAK